jgi:(p)ppGpp synthase/HD superfamily hydrolase
LLDYKIIDPVLLKASVIHDLFEDAPGMPGVSCNEISSIDSDGPAVYDLVMEVTQGIVEGVREPKVEYLRRLMRHGSPKARLLKLADRISNLIALGFVHEQAFVRRFLEETKREIIPYAKEINPDMYKEMSDLVSDREEKLKARLKNDE